MNQIFLIVILLSYFSLSQASDSRYMVVDQSRNIKSLSRVITNQGGQVLRPMLVTEALIAYLDQEAVEKVSALFPHIRFIKDKIMPLPSYTMTEVLPGPLRAQDQPYGIDDVKAVEAHALGYTGEGVSVCVIDTGIDTDHEDLKFDQDKSINFSSKKVDDKFVVDPEDIEDAHGHGTHVAGTIAALDNGYGVVGVAPDANIIAMRVFGSGSGATYSDIMDAVVACKDAGADVINMSLGGYSKAADVCNEEDSAECLFKKAVDDAVESGVIVVVAAGNSSGDIKNYIPAGFDSVIAVSAVNSSSKFANFSNYGLGEGHFAAPGVDTLSTWRNGDYIKISGTSMASPHVAGVAALMISSKSLGIKADKLSNLKDTQQGDGFINALETVKYQ